MAASIAIPPFSTPEPDIVLTSQAGGDGLIPVESVALVVEVADATIDNDLGAKATLYASASVPEYWVVDVNERIVHQMWAPEDGVYGERREMALGDAISSATLAGVSVITRDLA